MFDLSFKLQYLLMHPVSCHWFTLMIPGNLKSHSVEFFTHIKTWLTVGIHWTYSDFVSVKYNMRVFTVVQQFTLRLVCKADSGGYTMKCRSVKPKPWEFLWSTSVRGPCQDMALPSAPPPRTGRGLSLVVEIPSLRPFVYNKENRTENVELVNKHALTYQELNDSI